MLKSDFGLIFWIHILVILAYLATPFFLGWQWILLVVILFYIQNLFFKNCVLTKAQLDSNEEVLEDEKSFYAYYFKKAGLKVNPRWVKKYFAYSLLWTVFIFSVFWQIDLNNQVLVNNIF